MIVNMWPHSRFACLRKFIYQEFPKLYLLSWPPVSINLHKESVINPKIAFQVVMVGSKAVILYVRAWLLCGFPHASFYVYLHLNFICCFITSWLQILFLLFSQLSSLLLWISSCHQQTLPYHCCRPLYHVVYGQVEHNWSQSPVELHWSSSTIAGTADLLFFPSSNHLCIPGHSPLQHDCLVSLGFWWVTVKKSPGKPHGWYQMGFLYACLLIP